MRKTQHRKWKTAGSESLVFGVGNPNWSVPGPETIQKFGMDVLPDHSHETFPKSPLPVQEAGMPSVTCPVRGVPGVLRPERAADRSGASAGAGVGRSREDQTTTEDGRVGRGREFRF